MQKVVYSCDHCKKPFGDKKHISVSFGSYSGVAVPPGTALVPVNKGQIVDGDQVTTHWRVTKTLQGKFLHFCNGVCIGRYFSELMKKPGIE